MNYKDLAADLLCEPADHALGRSRGGLSSKIHQLVDGAGRPLVVLVAAGHGGDSPMLATLLTHLHITRRHAPPRTRPAAVIADKAYSSRANRALLRRRRIQPVIAEPADQTGHRRRRGSQGSRPPAFDPGAYRGRNVIERCFNTVKHWRALATRYDKLATVYRGGAVLRAVTIWLNHLFRDTP